MANQTAPKMVGWIRSRIVRKDVEPAPERLRRMRKQAASDAQRSNGWLRRVRRSIWSMWLQVLIWAAEATWKRWLLVFSIIIQIRIEGPAVVPLQTGFAQNWLETTGELVSGGDYFPPPKPSGALAAQSILSDPETGFSAARIMYYLSIVCAHKSILIANSYFVPDKQAIEILADAERRGVDVKIMVAGIHNDNQIARDNSTRLYGNLLEAGVEIYEYNRTMLHHKFMVCDGVWSTVGTTSFDNRSFGLNDENNVCVYNRDFAAQWTRIFIDDLEACHRITLDEWRSRGAMTKLREMIASLLRNQV